MQEYLWHFVDAARYGLAPFMVILLVCLGIVWLIGKSAGLDTVDALLLSACFGAIGVAVGLFMGASRDGVVGTMVPAVLTFLSAFAVYQFGKESYERWRPVLPVALFSLVLCTVCAAAFGASERNSYVERLRRYEEWRIQYEKMEIPLRVKQLEKNLNLPADKPKAE